MRRAALALTACAVLPGAVAARAAPVPVVLPSPTTPLSSEPPLAATPVAVTEVRLPGQVDSSQTVFVRLAPTGDPQAVAVVQRLVVHGTGDYSFTVPAPVLEVVAARGTESQPGKRVNEIVWQGFTSQRRVLAARATLQPRAAVPFLPLTVSVVPSAGRVRVTIANTTGVPVSAPTGPASRPELLAYVRELRRHLTGGPDPGAVVPVARRGERRVDVVVPFRVHGTVALRGARVATARGGDARRTPRGVDFTATIGRGGPFVLELAADSPAVPRLSVVGRPERPRLTAALPRDRRRAFDLAVDASLLLARGRQYATFVASPDPDGRRQATYVFRTAVKAPQTQPASPPNGGSGDSVFRLLAFLAMGVVCAAALVVLWAHL